MRTSHESGSGEGSERALGLLASESGRRGRLPDRALRHVLEQWVVASQEPVRSRSVAEAGPPQRDPATGPQCADDTVASA